MKAAQKKKLAEAKIDAVLELLMAAGHTEVSPPLLQPAEVFLDLIGEDIRRRLFLTNGSDGTDLCLRPDFTIPICRHYLQNAPIKLPAAYCYSGHVFRQRTDGYCEIPQVGAESVGRADTIDADADMLVLAIRALEVIGFGAGVISIGDEALFAALLERLDLPAAWQRRLSDLFGDNDQLLATIERMAGAVDPSAQVNESKKGLLAALGDSEPDAAKTIVEDLLSIAGISAVGGRTPGEIALRLVEQSALSSGTNGHEESVAILKEYLELHGTGENAVSLLRSFSAKHALKLDAPIAAFEARLSAIGARGVSISQLNFAAKFGRRLDYYSGFVFEIHANTDALSEPLIGGGRYDKLLTLLGAQDSAPAVGFSMWLDRVAASIEL